MADLGRPHSFWLIGCGNMAGAMLRRWVQVRFDPTLFLVIRPSGAHAAPGVHVVTQIPQGPQPEIVLLGIKPQMLDAVAPELAPALGPDTLLISILAGVTQDSLRRRFPQVRNIIRAMPNTPVRIGHGAISFHADSLDESVQARVERLADGLGQFEWIADESQLDIVAALTASGPAFVFRFIDALAAGAAAHGLPAEQAERLAVATVHGAGALASWSGESPRQLAERVASPGGMTRKGLDVLDDSEALNRLVEATLDAAALRSRELGESARKA